MFTLDNIYAAFEKVNNNKDFAAFFKKLKEIGVSHYDYFVEDGHTEYFDKKGKSITSEPRYSKLKIGHENAISVTSLIEQQRKGEIDYDTFCRKVAENGIIKWKTDLENMRVIYFNPSGESVFQEPVAVE